MGWTCLPCDVLCRRVPGGDSPSCVCCTKALRACRPVADDTMATRPQVLSLSNSTCARVCHVGCCARPLMPCVCVAVVPVSVLMGWWAAPLEPSASYLVSLGAAWLPHNVFAVKCRGHCCWVGVSKYGTHDLVSSSLQRTSCCSNKLRYSSSLVCPLDGHGWAYPEQLEERLGCDLPTMLCRK